MHFPSWIDGPRKPPAKRAQLRLQYMLSLASLRKYGRASIREIAARSGVDHSSMFAAIKRGYFTQPMAERVEKAVGRTELPAEYLTAPLEVTHD